MYLTLCLIAHAVFDYMLVVLVMIILIPSRSYCGCLPHGHGPADAPVIVPDPCLASGHVATSEYVVSPAAAFAPSADVVLVIALVVVFATVALTAVALARAAASPG